MALLSGKQFNGSPSLLEYGPTTWPACEAFHSQILPISPIPSLTNMSPHFSCLISQPHGSSTFLSLQCPDVMKFPFPPTWSPRLSLGINFSRKTPSTQAWIWFPSEELPQPLSIPVLTLIARKHNIHLLVCLPLSIRWQDPGRQRWSFVFESSQITNHA